MVSVPLRKTGKSRMLRCQRNTTQHPPISNQEIYYLFPFALLCVLHSIWQSNRQDSQACCQCIASHWLVQKSPVCCVANATPPSVRPPPTKRFITYSLSPCYASCTASGSQIDKICKLVVNVLRAIGSYKKEKTATTAAVLSVISTKT